MGGLEVQRDGGLMACGIGLVTGMNEIGREKGKIGKKEKKVEMWKEKGLE